MVHLWQEVATFFPSLLWYGCRCLFIKIQRHSIFACKPLIPCPNIFICTTSSFSSTPAQMISTSASCSYLFRLLQRDNRPLCSSFSASIFESVTNFSWEYDTELTLWLSEEEYRTMPDTEIMQVVWSATNILGVLLGRNCSEKLCTPPIHIILVRCFRRIVAWRWHVNRIEMWKNWNKKENRESYSKDFQTLRCDDNFIAKLYTRTPVLIKTVKQEEERIKYRRDKSVQYLITEAKL